MGTDFAEDVQRTSLDDGRWVSILDYAATNGVSLSTLRRYIKAKKIPFRMEKGRYLLWVGPAGHDAFAAKEKMTVFQQDMRKPQAASTQPVVTAAISPPKGQSEIEMMLRNRVNELEGELRNVTEELSELKMLVAIYEEKLLGEARD